MIKDLSEITLKWGKRQLFKINEWIKPYQAYGLPCLWRHDLVMYGNETTRKTKIWKEGVNYQYQIEMVTSDEKTLNMRLSSSLTDFTKAKISGNKINLITFSLRIFGNSKIDWW